MAPKDWLAITIGVFIVAAGIVIFVKRRWILQATINGQRAAFGQRVGSSMNRKAKPSSVAFVGVGAVIIGLILIVVPLVKVLNHI